MSLGADRSTPAVQWSLYAAPDGSALYVSGQGSQGSRDYLRAAIEWPADTWHLVLLAYTPTNSALYLDGELAAAGDPLPVPPAPTAPALALVLGSDITGAFQARKTYGSQTYPVEFDYDPQGRVKTMKTWQNYAGGQGAATTTWIYNQRGLLQDKLYPGNVVGQSYTYTAAGRLKTRTSARNIVATYHYAFEDASTYGGSADLVQVSYANDPLSTPAVNLSFDRAGRLKTGGQAGGLVSTFLYSDADGLVSETFSGGDLAGISITNRFDTLGRRTTNGAVLSGAWLAQGAYTYDNASRLSVASLPQANVSATYAYAIMGTKPLLCAEVEFFHKNMLRLSQVGAILYFPVSC